MILDYTSTRQNFIEETMNKTKYHGLEFTDREKLANTVFLSKIRAGFSFKDDFYTDLAMKYKKEIESHSFFEALKNMPKGALLHHHMTDCIQIGWLKKVIVSNMADIYFRDFSKEPKKTKYPTRLVYTKAKKEHDTPFEGVLKSWREKNPGKNIDDYLQGNLTMLPNELSQAQNNEECWSIFMPKYFFALPLILFKEFYKEHLLNTFRQCVKDKVYRLESRLTPGRLTDKNMNLIPIEEEMELYKQCVDEIRQKYNKNFTFGIIVEIVKIWRETEISDIMKKACELKLKYGDLIVGIDLDGDEDHFPSFEKLSKLMLDAKEEQRKLNIDIPWILHCGESLKVTNLNTLDGCLMSAKRLGHGINLVKQPCLWEILKTKKICIEINPISNQTLKNVRDLRMHPAISYFNYGINICISNDDPTLYNTKGVNYDFFVATVCCEFDLLDLKVIVLNSIDSSEAKSEEKQSLRELLLEEWGKFIEGFIKKYS